MEELSLVIVKTHTAIFYMLRGSKVPVFILMDAVSSTFVWRQENGDTYSSVVR